MGWALAGMGQTDSGMVSRPAMSYSVGLCTSESRIHRPWIIHIPGGPKSFSQAHGLGGRRGTPQHGRFGCAVMLLAYCMYRTAQIRAILFPYPAPRHTMPHPGGTTRLLRGVAYVTNALRCAAHTNPPIQCFLLMHYCCSAAPMAAPSLWFWFRGMQGGAPAWNCPKLPFCCFFGALLPPERSRHPGASPNTPTAPARQTHSYGQNLWQANESRYQRHC
jgi:hypothetical protein